MCIRMVRLPAFTASILQLWHVIARSPEIARAKSRIIKLKGPCGFGRADFSPGRLASLIGAFLFTP